MDLSLPQVFVEWALALIFIWLFTKFLVAPIRRLLDERAATVRSDYDQAEAAKTEMESLRADYEARMDRLEEEVREKLAEAAQRGEALIAQMEAKARESAAKSMERVEREVAETRERLRRELREEAARLVVQVSERFLATRLDSEDSALVDRLMEEVAGSLEA